MVENRSLRTTVDSGSIAASGGEASLRGFGGDNSTYAALGSAADNYAALGPGGSEGGYAALQGAQGRATNGIYDSGEYAAPSQNTMDPNYASAVSPDDIAYTAVRSGGAGADGAAAPAAAGGQAPDGSTMYAAVSH